MAAKRPPNVVETTPSGIEVAFWDEVGVDGKPQRRRYGYGPERLKAPSVSTVAGTAEDKGGLLFAACKLTGEGAIALAAAGRPIEDFNYWQLRSALQAKGLDHESVWGEAAERGTQAHDNLLDLIRDGKVAKLSDYEKAIKPYIAAGMKMVVEREPKVVAAEVMVVSVKHRFAGRSDLLAKMGGATWRLDYKTVGEWKREKNNSLRDPYPGQRAQLSLYELAARESGYPPADALGLVQLGPDGDYRLFEVEYNPGAAIKFVEAYHARSEL